MSETDIERVAEAMRRARVVAIADGKVCNFSTLARAAIAEQAAIEAERNQRMPEDIQYAPLGRPR